MTSSVRPPVQPVNRELVTFLVQWLVRFWKYWMDMFVMLKVVYTFHLNLHAQNDHLEGLDTIKKSFNLVQKDLYSIRDVNLQAIIMQKFITCSMVLVLCLYDDMILHILFWLWSYVWFTKLELLRICFGTKLCIWLSSRRCFYYICHYFKLMAYHYLFTSMFLMFFYRIIINFVNVHYLCLTHVGLKDRLHHDIFKCFIYKYKK